MFSAIRFNSDATLLVTGSPARTIDVWDTVTGNRLQTWKVSAKKDTRPKSAVVYDVAFGDNKQIISESSNGLSEIWQMK